MLEYLGHHVTIASDGRRGLDIVLQERPEIVITDFMMPMMSGLEMITHLREKGHDLPIVLCSAVAESMLPPHAAHYDAFLKKPYDLRALVQAIESVKGKKRS